MDGDLANLVKEKNMKFTPQEVKLITYQLLDGLKFMHACNVVHRDLVNDLFNYLLKFLTILYIETSQSSHSKQDNYQGIEQTSHFPIFQY